MDRLFIFQVFFFQEVAYPPEQGRFLGHVEWSGDVMKRDASITLNNVPPTFNGTYTCQVHNRPDVHGSNGEIMLRVVEKGQARCELGVISFSSLLLAMMLFCQHSCIRNSVGV